MEIWKSLIYQGQNYGDRLEVSNQGRIRNIKTGTIYKLDVSKTGYYGVVISLGNRRNKKRFRVHKAVAETFIPNPENKPEVNHIDGDKSNNCTDNLEWVTGSENITHAFENGLINIKTGVERPNAKLTVEQIKDIRQNCIPRSQKYGYRAFARKYNIDKDNIRKAHLGITYKNIK